MYRHVIEIVTIAFNILCWLHLYHVSRSLRKTLVFFVGAIFLGSLTEIAAIVTTGGYSYPGFWWYVGPIPLMIAIGWGCNFYLAYCIADVISRPWSLGRWQIPVFGLTAGLVGLLLDLCFDPVAVALEWWTWEKGGPFYGVPTANFFGWTVFCGGFAFAHRWVTSKNWGWLKESLIFAAALVGVFAAAALSAFPFY